MKISSNSVFGAGWANARSRFVRIAIDFEPRML
jgi:hypothetical protein